MLFPLGLGSFSLSSESLETRMEQKNDVSTSASEPSTSRTFALLGGNRPERCPSTPDHLSPFSLPIGSYVQVSISIPPPLKTQDLLGGFSGRSDTDTITAKEEDTPRPLAGQQKTTNYSQISYFLG